MKIALIVVSVLCVVCVLWIIREMRKAPLLHESDDEPAPL